MAILTALSRAVLALLTRRSLAAVTMLAGVGSATTGSYIQWGPGIGLIVLAGLLIPLSILIGWE